MESDKLASILKNMGDRIEITIWRINRLGDGMLYDGEIRYTPVLGKDKILAEGVGKTIEEVLDSLLSDMKND